NDCSEIGTADVRILFSGSEIYKATLAIPLRATVEETLAPAVITIPAAIANTFWTTGLKSLELEVTGNGPGGGPYQISVPLNVIPEPIDDTWWTWGPSPAAAAWKSTYAITGTFANRGLVNMTVTELTAREHPTDVMGPGSDLIVAPTSSVPTVVALPGGSVSALWLRNQTWTWLARGTFVEVGPRSRTFSYTAIFSVMDTFGNVYPMVGSAPTTATVTVPFSKLNSHSEGITLVSFGLAFLVAAVVAAAAGGPYGWIGAVIIAAAGMALIIKGTFDLYDAYDPPVPDFREHGPKLPDPAAWKLPVAEDPELHALGTLALLIARLVSTQLRARQHADRAWAAFVDRDESARTERRDAIRNEHETLRRLVRATADAADEARESWEKLLKGVRTLPTHEALLQMVSRVADEIGLTGSERALVEGRLQAADRETLRQALQHVRDQGTGSIGDLARRFYESIGARLSGYEHLR
ncbi:MAG TPA: hypothetical protein VKB34_17155, partial [Povalibacter sp.]|nr:hypothetical protein [Povalibacter sp.]